MNDRFRVGPKSDLSSPLLRSVAKAGRHGKAWLGEGGNDFLPDIAGEPGRSPAGRTSRGTPVAWKFAERSRFDNATGDGGDDIMEEEICLQGLLIPMDWQGNGRVKTVALATDDEREIFIRNPLDQRIMSHLRERVELWGRYADVPDQSIFEVNRLQFQHPRSESRSK